MSWVLLIIGFIQHSVCRALSFFLPHDKAYLSGESGCDKRLTIGLSLSDRRRPNKHKHSCGVRACLVAPSSLLERQAWDAEGLSDKDPWRGSFLPMSELVTGPHFPGPERSPVPQWASRRAGEQASWRTGGRAGGWLVAATAHPATLFSFPMIVSTPHTLSAHSHTTRLPSHPLLTSCYTLVSRLYLGSFLTLVQWPWKEGQRRMREDDTLALGARHISVPSCTSCKRYRRIGSLRRPILISDAVDLTRCRWHSVFHDTVSQWAPRLRECPSRDIYDNQAKPTRF